MLESHCRRLWETGFIFNNKGASYRKKYHPSLVISMLGRIVCLYLDFRKAGATAAAAAASLLPSSGFWPASPNVSRCLNDLKKKKKN